MSEHILPAEVSVHSETWLTRYRIFPVFSRAWYLHRAYSWMSVIWFVFGLLMCVSWFSDRDMRIFFAFAIPFFIASHAMALTGAGFAVLIKQKNLEQSRETWLLLLVLSVSGIANFFIFELLRYLASYIAYGDGNLVLSLMDIKHKAGDFHPLFKPVLSEVNVEKNQHAEVVKEIVEKITILISVIHMASGFDVWIYFRQRNKLQEIARLQELQNIQAARREAEIRLSVLAAQIEPHFLFNTLAGVRSAILTEPLRAAAIIDHLVDYLRISIPKMREDGSLQQSRLAQQLDAVRAYLSLMQARMSRLSFQISSEVEDAALPPLMLISLVENAIKHGIEPKIGPAFISVKAVLHETESAQHLQIAVIDNGVGFGGTTSGSGLGLANIRERLESTYGAKAKLTLRANPEGGVAAMITIPYLT